MNVSARLTSLFTGATPDAGAPSPIAPSTTPAAAPLAEIANAVDAFDAGCSPRAPTPQLPQLVVTGPTVSASTLLIQGAAALKTGAKGPLVLAEPISTETKAMKAPKGFAPVALEVPWYSQFEDHGSVKGGNTSCNPMVKEMMTSGKNPAAPRGGDDASNFNIADAKDTAGRISPNSARAAEGRAYMDAQLVAGNPVMAGVTWRTPSPGFNGGNADHYVVVTGRGVDADGRAFYSFHDPGAKSAAKGSDAREQNRFYVDEGTGMLFRPGLQNPPGKMFSTDARYEVSQIRKNQ